MIDGRVAAPEEVTLDEQPGGVDRDAKSTGNLEVGRYRLDRLDRPSDRDAESSGNGAHLYLRRDKDMAVNTTTGGPPSRPAQAGAGSLGTAMKPSLALMLALVSMARLESRVEEARIGG